MALFRSEVINKYLVESVVKKLEATNRVSLSTLTVAPCQPRGSLFEERLMVEASAEVKGHAKTYIWIAKLLPCGLHESPLAATRAQNCLEKERSFYSELLPRLKLLKGSLPTFCHSVWRDRDILLLEDLTSEGYEPVQSEDITKGLNLPQVILTVEWLAKFHGLSYAVLMSSREDPKPEQNWTEAFISQAEDPSESNFKTFCHGEMWAGNLWFKSVEDLVEDKLCPVDVVVGDFHACCIGDPAMDLANFLLTSTTSQFRMDHLDMVLSCYLTELKDIIQSQGLHPDCYSFTELSKGYKYAMSRTIMRYLELKTVDTSWHLVSNLMPRLMNEALDEAAQLLDR